LIDSRHDADKVNDILQERAFSYVHCPFKRPNLPISKEDFIAWKRRSDQPVHIHPDGSVTPAEAGAFDGVSGVNRGLSLGDAAKIRRDVMLVSSGKVEKPNYQWSPNAIIGSVFQRTSEAIAMEDAFNKSLS